MKKKAEGNMSGTSPEAHSLPPQVAPRTRFQEQMRRLRTEGLVNDTVVTGNTFYLVEYLVRITGPVPPWPSDPVPPDNRIPLQVDKDVPVPQLILNLITDIATGKVDARYRPIPYIDRLRPGALREMQDTLAQEIREGAPHGAVKHAEMSARLKAAGWRTDSGTARQYPERKGDITKAAIRLLAHQVQMQEHIEGLKERLRETPHKRKKNKTGKSATDCPEKILRKK
ncbi:MAG: hypothetical protein ABI790_11345 [Betaproteobacteria bacterium]